MITAVAFAVAAGIGGVLRADAGHRWNRHDGWPLGTLAVNVVGSLCLGLLHDTAAPAVTVIGVGGLGALTTFSSFARDVVALVEVRRVMIAIAYAIASCVLSVGAAALGIALT